ncbi:glutathione S-transferase [Fomitopsis serialis]|uniref:glutathione S-transferase n=1 Tax=Fomitopsis serialis TaxID=139415 RepID=UPI002007D924|nr:glutathione S-transferase [Neoantrodia serialis]KAH9919706.1 glutathione S-transferase [Neoantrodia serialis]
MTSPASQFTLYSSVIAPNGWKVAIVLEELSLTYETVYLNFQQGEHKAPEHTKYNPNGRIPTLIDHGSGDFVIWESDAILTYLAEKYDPGHKISVSECGDRIHQLQWLFFQASGQGPYFGQSTWFLYLHHEKLPSAIERYQKEVLRVFGVLESVLSRQDWLAGGKCTIADLSFIPWNDIVLDLALKDYNDFNFESDFPALHKWHTAMMARPSVQKVWVAKALIQDS